MAVVEALSEEEAYLLAIITDPSGLDLAEFSWYEGDTEDNCFRAWPFQWAWWHCIDPQQIDACARSVGKSLSIRVRGFAFPFLHPGEEMVVTAPELVHLEPIVNLIENQFFVTRLGREMLQRGRSSITHRPFMMNFANSARIIGRIPQRDGKGVKGIHPIWLELDEAQDYPRCLAPETLVLTSHGYKPIKAVVVGDKVLTHERRWKPVESVQRTKKLPYLVHGHGHPGLITSGDHLFMTAIESEVQVRDSVRSVDGFRRLRTERALTRPGWVAAADLDRDCFWASPTRFPKVSAPPSPVSVGGSRGLLCFNECSEEFMWAMGLYLADGCTEFRDGAPYRTSYACHEDQAEYVAKHLTAMGLKVSTYESKVAKCASVVVLDPVFAQHLYNQCGHGALVKQIPTWVYGLRTRWRAAVLDGMIFGDGFDDPDGRYAPGRWKITTAGRPMAASIRTLAGTLGYSVSWYWVPDDREHEVRGRTFKMTNGGWFQIVGQATSDQVFDYSLHRYQRVTASEQMTTEPIEMYDLVIADDHSFIAEGVVVHNSGWIELSETLKRGFEGAVWRAHGVTRGMRDKFFEYSQPGSGWTVHNFPAMARPNFTDEERDAAMKRYGGRDDPDYRRNMLGAHGDVANRLFVLSRLMRCVDVDESSDFNTDDYYRFDVKDTGLESQGVPIEDLLEFPVRHHRYKTLWCGMDVGFTSDPSEILVFAEYHPDANELRVDKAIGRASPENGLSRVKCIARVSLRRIAHPDQVKVILRTIDFYKPRAFSMDKTGNGLPLFQAVQAEMQAEAMKSASSLEEARLIAEVIKGYNFSEKVVVDIDSSVALDKPDDHDKVISEAGMKRNVLEYSTDVLRDFVDNGRLLLPIIDKEMLAEFSGQTFAFSKEPMDGYGRKRRIFSEGRFHALDAARMAVMGLAQAPIETFINTKVQQVPVYDSFVTM